MSPNSGGQSKAVLRDPKSVSVVARSTMALSFDQVVVGQHCRSADGSPCALESSPYKYYWPLPEMPIPRGPAWTNKPFETKPRDSPGKSPRNALGDRTHHRSLIHHKEQYRDPAPWSLFNDGFGARLSCAVATALPFAERLFDPLSLADVAGAQ